MGLYIEMLFILSFLDYFRLKNRISKSDKIKYFISIIIITILAYLYFDNIFSESLTGYVFKICGG